MANRWIALEPIQVLQSLTAEPVTLVAGRPILVRGYMHFDEWNKDFEATLEVSVISMSSRYPDHKTVDRTVTPVVATIDRSTVEYLEQLHLPEVEYLKLSRNIIGNSVNWLIRPEDFEHALGFLKSGEEYFLQLDARSKHSDDVFSNSGAIFLDRQEPDGRFYTSESDEFGRDFGAFYITGDAELRVNVLGLRYRDYYGNDEYPTVEEHQFALAKSYLEASFPVGEIHWTSVNLNAPAAFVPPFTNGHRHGTDFLLQARVNTANAFIAAVRANDINIGVDQRTFYYGMINAADNAFEGASSNVPEHPSHLAVATGPADNSTGYYCAHELGHMLGQTHQGGVNQKSENFHDWYTRPRRTSNNRRDDLLLRMDRDGSHQQRLPWKDTVDLMSYGEQTWPSFSTHFELRKRLEALSRLSESQRLTPPAVNTRVLFVSGTYDLHHGVGELQYVLPLALHPHFDVGHDSWTLSGAGSERYYKDRSSQHQTDQMPGLSLVIIRGAEQIPVTIDSSKLHIRRKTLDFPVETGMFQAMIDVDDLVSDSAVPTEDPPYQLTLVREATVVDTEGHHRFGKYTQLDQLELALVPYTRAQHYGRIRPSELDLRPTDDSLGFYLRIDHQLRAMELVDCSFIVEVCPADSTSDWRTVALKVRTGEDVFLDARVNGGLGLTETVRKRKLLTKLATRTRKQAIQIFGEHALMSTDIELADRSRSFMARVRIVATRGLDKVIVFDGLLAESPVREDRTLCISVDRRHRVQNFFDKGKTTQEELENENTIVNDLLQECRQIFCAMESVDDFDTTRLDTPQFSNAIMQLAELNRHAAKKVISSSSEIRFVLQNPPESIDSERSVYYSYQ